MGCSERGKLNNDFVPKAQSGRTGWPEHPDRNLERRPEALVHLVAQETLSPPLYSCDNLLQLGIH